MPLEFGYIPVDRHVVRLFFSVSGEGRYDEMSGLDFFTSTTFFLQERDRLTRTSSWLTSVNPSIASC